MSNSRILYLECDKRDFVEKFLMHNTNYWMRMEDGKIDYRRQMQFHTPWIYHNPPKWQNCHLWHHIYFDIIHQKKCVPSECQRCWKVVIMPRTLEELFAVYLLQQTLGRPGKCGTETERDNTDRLYGGYWYNHSREEGEDCYRAVVNAVTEIEAFQRDLFGCPVRVRFNKDPLPKIILKRGCTEYEQHVGPSDEWAVTPEQAETEEIANGVFVDDRTHPTQPDHLIAHIMKSWIHQAFRVGDETYKIFSNGNRLFATTISYHKEE
jgi:hypothetical protein